MKPNITALTTSIFTCFTLTAALAQEDASGTPLDEITQEMKVAANHLSKRTTDKQTQTPQSEAVAKIDKLIAALEKERQSLGSMVTPNPMQAANASTIRTGPGGMGDLHGAREQGNRWGDLPAHERDRILQSLTEGFPAHYQSVLEAYYKRLAVEKKADESDQPANPAKPDAKPSAAPTKPIAPEKKSGQ